MEKHTEHRKDIDGLRALAIVPVVLFHAGIAGFGGGFVGVDIFFVISGFLITGIILRELASGSFSFVKFWERRARRILPALFFITSCVVIGGFFILLYPIDFVDFGHSLIAQSLFLANIFFMRKSGYFAGPSESMPLLHTWSLSIEEQFYIGLPIMLFFVWYFTKQFYVKTIAVILLAIACASFFYNVYLTELNPGGAFVISGISYVWGSATNLNAGFFFLLPRAWELLLGSLLATGLIAIRQRWIAEVLTIGGIGAIAYAVVMFSSATPFPGFAALVPTLGAAGIILGNTYVRTKAGDLLSFPLLVGVGLISYSLYLWHWPVLVFSKIILENTEAYIPLILCLIFILAWFTYQFIETPFRNKTFCPKTYQMFLFSFIAIGTLVAGGFFIHYQKGFPNRAPDEAKVIAAASIDGNPREFECFRKNYKEVFSLGEPCLLGIQNKEEIDFVLWGDSHSDSAMPIIDLMAKEQGMTGAFFGAGGCRPMVWEGMLSKDERCEQIKNQAIGFIQDHNIKKVLFISSWESDPSKLVPDGNLGMQSNTQNEGSDETFYDALKHTVELVSTGSNEIYVMRRVPVYQNYDVRKLFTKAALTGGAMDPATQTLAFYQEDTKVENDAIDKLVQEGLITAMDPKEVFCNQEVCSVVLDGAIIYKNGGHLNTAGALHLRPIFSGFFGIAN